MLILYKYLYYRLYTWNLKTWGENDLPQFNALFGVSFMMYTNLGIVFGILELCGLNIFVKETPVKEIIIIMFVIVTINYFWLVHKRKYKNIGKNFINESKNKRLRNTFLLWLYLFASFGILGLTITLSRYI